MTSSSEQKAWDDSVTNPEARDAAAEAIVALAHDSFSAVEAIWREPWTALPIPGASGPWSEIVRRILQCPTRASAAAAIAADPVIGTAIASGNLYVGLSGSGGILQAEVVPLELLQSACMELAALSYEMTEDHLVDAALRSLEGLRKGVAGERFDGWQLTGFRGVVLSPDIAVETPWGRLVHADRMSSEMWAPDGCSAVLATPISSFLRERSGSSLAASDPESREHSTKMWQIAHLVSCGVALGSSPDDPTTAVPISSGELLPIGMIGRGGAVRFVGFHNRSSPISGEEAIDMNRWMACLHDTPLERIDVALRRLVRGLAERVDYLGSLIDAVIAWKTLSRIAASQRSPSSTASRHS